ncbi:MAG: hypothetical protein J2P40_02545 [Candidatus Dormibacteraeota bacterium]|nr:hypothetical protein [Candidatus Dormibacteraeota bacterium]MBO0760132.1 hypothetical protein [Candidatus Dormibacteraeota bacterium]
MSPVPIYLHGFGVRYGLPVPLSLYLYGAGAVVVFSFVLVVLFASRRRGASATQYPLWEARWLWRLGTSPAVRFVMALIGVLSLLVVVVVGFLGSQTATQNPASYVVWVYFWAGSVILVGLLGNYWTYLNPFRTIYRLVARLVPHGNRHLPDALGIWPAAAGYFLFAWVELASGEAAHPAVVAGLAAGYTVLTVLGMLVFSPDSWLGQCEVFTVLFGIVGRFGPLQTARDESGALTGVWVRPWGVGLLDPVRAGWDRVVFVMLMLSSLAFDGIIGTGLWNNELTSSDGPFGASFGSWPDPVQHTIGLACISLIFLLLFSAFMRAVVWLGGARGDVVPTLTAFALTLVPIALVYDAAHNYTYVTVTSQGVIPLLADPLQRGWHLLPVTTTFTPNLVFAQAATVWYAQVVLIVLGHVLAVYLAHRRAEERFEDVRAVLISQYPMLLLMVAYTMTSLWILAQPITGGG